MGFDNFARVCLPVIKNVETCRFHRGEEYGCTTQKMVVIECYNSDDYIPPSAKLNVTPLQRNFEGRFSRLR